MKNLFLIKFENARKKNLNRIVFKRCEINLLSSEQLWVQHRVLLANDIYVRIVRMVPDDQEPEERETNDSFHFILN